MFTMLSWFDIKQGYSPRECQQALDELAEHMLAQGLITGVGPLARRETDTILDTDSERSQQYFMLMHFHDKAQSDLAVEYIKSRSEPGASIHKNAYSRLSNLVFICWEDLPAQT